MSPMVGKIVPTIISNTTQETAFFQFMVPPGLQVLGTVLEANVTGSLSLKSGTRGTLAIKGKVDGNTITTVIIELGSGSQMLNVGWRIHSIRTIRQIGVDGRIVGYLQWTSSEGLGNRISAPADEFPVDTTTPTMFLMSAQFSIADINNIFRAEQGHVSTR